MHGNLHPQVDDLVKALGVEAGISKSEVSRICGELDGEVAALRSRSLGHTSFPYLFMDATSPKANSAGYEWAVTGAVLLLAAGFDAVVRRGSRAA